jgi:predicted ribosomally synthesized peptide with SipW-like signal peptide
LLSKEEKMKTKVLIIAVLLISIAMFSTGAYAYFTASRTATSTVKTGTLGITIAASPSISSVPADWEFGETATPWMFDKLVPGESKSGCLWLMNTGDVGTVRARYDFTVLGTTGGTGSINLADRLSLTSVYTSDNGFNWIPSMLHTSWDPNNDGIVTLQEMANYGGDWQNDIDPFVAVAPGGKGAICMTFQMINGTPAVDNAYQGATLTYSALVTAFNPAP